MPRGSGNIGSWKTDMAAMEGDIVTITADIILIFALLVDLDVMIVNIENLVEEIAGHLHTYERWMQPTKQLNAPTHVASRIGLGIGDFQIDAGTDTWGTWVQILGSTDTPIIGGSDYYDLSRVVFTSTERDGIHFVQFGFGISGAQAIIDDTLTEVVYNPVGNLITPDPTDILTDRQEDGTLAWARCWCPGQDGALMDFFIGIHEYAD